MGTMYHAEVPLKIEIPLVSDLGIEYVLQVEGRADGIIADINYDEDGNKEPESDAIIDEIKTMQTDVSLLNNRSMCIKPRHWYMVIYMQARRSCQRLEFR